MHEAYGLIWEEFHQKPHEEVLIVSLSSYPVATGSMACAHQVKGDLAGHSMRTGLLIPVHTGSSVKLSGYLVRTGSGPRAYGA